jgi:hypothetical protein
MFFLKKNFKTLVISVIGYFCRKVQEIQINKLKKKIQTDVIRVLKLKKKNAVLFSLSVMSVLKFFLSLFV